MYLPHADLMNAMESAVLVGFICGAFVATTVLCAIVPVVAFLSQLTARRIPQPSRDSRGSGD